MACVLSDMFALADLLFQTQPALLDICAQPDITALLEPLAKLNAQLEHTKISQDKEHANHVQLDFIAVKTV